MRTLSSVDAQNRFGELLDSTQREPVTITRRGRAVAVMISPQDMEILLNARRQREVAVTAFERFFTRTESKLKATTKLSDVDVTRLVRELR